MSAGHTISNPAIGVRPVRSGRGMFAALMTMAGAELVNRLSRLVAAIFLARHLSALEFGVAAIVLTSSDIFRVFAQTGIGARIISAAADDLDEVSHAAYRLNWMAYGVVFALHIVLAYPLAQAFGNSQISAMVLALAVPCLILPFASVQVFRVQRENRMHFTALMSLVSLSGESLLIAVGIVAGLGLWSVVLPKVVLSLVWVIAYRRSEPWRPRHVVPLRQLASHVRFGLTVLGTELVAALQIHADKLLLGQLVGLSVLGSYYFAFNAGLGITSALVTAGSTAMLPHLARSNAAITRKPLLKSMGLFNMAFLPVFAAQISLAPFYVPLVFGAKWTETVPVIMMLCASGIPMVTWRVLALACRAAGKPALEFRMTLLLWVFSLVGLLVTFPAGLFAIATSQLVATTFATLVFTFITFRNLQIGEAS